MRKKGSWYEVYPRDVPDDVRSFSSHQEAKRYAQKASMEDDQKYVIRKVEEVDYKAIDWRKQQDE